jgi:hypothetical protein
MLRIQRIVLALIITSFGAFAGLICGGIVGAKGFLALHAERQGITELPLPHHVPKFPEGITFRFAMAHDVIHERFARHGSAYYTERNQRVREALEKWQTGPRDDQAWAKHFALLDDLGVGLEALGQSAEAVQVMRDKLQEQQARGLQGKDLYTTYANLGTFLIHAHFGSARKGDAESRARMAEGLSFIRKSIEVNPQAHFGREVWQAVVAEYMLRAMNDPTLLVKCDLVCNRLDKEVDPSHLRCIDPDQWMHGQSRDAADLLQDPSRLDTNDVTRFRKAIARVGSEDDTKKSWMPEPVPFDEPALGIIGMWRLGGGANPHFAQALGEIMLRVGQRYIAWCAFERAALLKDRYWPDPAIQDKFLAHCRARQALVEAQLPPKEREQLRPRFEAELKYGQDYQREYQDYEARRIAEGTALDDPQFFDAFHAEHEPIASESGDEDKFLVEEPWRPAVSPAAMILFAGIFGFGTAWLITRRKS